MSTPPGTHWRPEDYIWDAHKMQAQTQKGREKQKYEDQGQQPPVARSAGSRETPEADDSKSRRTASEPTVSEGVGPKTELSGEQSGGETEGASREAAASAVPVVRDTLAAVHGPSKKKIPLQCQVGGCLKDLSKEKEYYQRYRICEDHLKLSSLIKDGIEQRFCQQCGRFHVLSDFDADKRSCRARLNLHNDRRRKRIPEQATPRQDLGNPQPRTRRTRTRRKRMPYGEEADPEDLEALDVQEPSVQGTGRQDPGGEEEGRRMLQPLEAQNEDLGEDEYQAGARMGRQVYPISISAALHGLPGMLPLHTISAGGLGSLQDINNELYGPSQQRQYSEPARGVQQNRQLGEVLSPRPSVAEMHAWISRRQANQEQEAAEQAAVQTGEGSQMQPGQEVVDGPPSGGRLYKCASEPVYSNLDLQAQLASGTWGLLTAPELSCERPSNTTGGDESSLSTRTHLHLQNPLAQDFWYQQQAQLLRGASWGSVDDASPHQRGAQGAQTLQDLEVSRYSLGGLSSGSEATYAIAGIAPGKQQFQRSPPVSPSVGPRFSLRNELPLGLMDPIQLSGEASSDARLGRRISDRHSGLQQVMSGASGISGQDSSLAQRFSVSEAVASLRRIGSGSSRLERMPSGGHRLQQMPTTSSPSLQSHESLYAQRNRPQEAPRAGGGFSYNAPSGWARHYRAFQEPEGATGSGEQFGSVEVGRAATKMHNILPESLPLHLREDYLRLLGPNTANLEAALRPGCTHLVATAVGQVPSRNALEAAQDLLQCGAPWTSGSVLIQLPRSAALITDGAVTHFWNEQDLQQLLPNRPITSTPAVVAGGKLAVFLPQGVAGPAKRLLASCNGTFWRDVKLERGIQQMELQIPQAAGEGVLWIEAEQDGLLSKAAAVLLSDSEDVVEEVQRFLAGSSGPQWGLQQSEGLLIDIGMVLQYAAFLGCASGPAASIAGISGHAGEQGGSAAAASRLQSAGCCQAVPPQNADPAAPGPMSDAVYVEYVTNAARHIFALCCCEGMPALATKVLAVAAVGVREFAALVASLEKLLRSSTLLQAAVLSGSLSMVIILLDLYERFGLACELASKPGTAAVLHTAAGMRDGGKMARLLRDRCPGAAHLWNSARDATGRAPADVAYMLAKEQRRGNAGLQEDIRKLTQQTSLLNSPPATPRVPALRVSPCPVSGGRLDKSPRQDVTAVCDGPQPLPDHWPRLSPRRFSDELPKAALQTQRVTEAQLRPAAALSRAASGPKQTLLTPRHASDSAEALHSDRARRTRSPFAGAPPIVETLRSPRFDPLLTVRHSWPSELEQLPHATLTSRPECIAISDPEDGSKLHTWPVTKVELTTLGGMKGSPHAGDSPLPMVIDVSVSAVSSSDNKQPP